VSRAADRWIAWVRLGAIVFAVLEVAVFTEDYPPGYETRAWVATALFAAGAVALFWLSRIETTLPTGLIALAFDTAAAGAYGWMFAWEYGSPALWVLILPVLEACVRFGLVGGVVLPLVLLPWFAFLEWWRADRFGPPDFNWDRVTFPFGIHLISGLIVGWLVWQLRTQTNLAETRADEAEGLRDRLGRRVDVLDAANRCARALASSLELDQAFGAFIRELQGLVPFDRTAIVLGEDSFGRVIATAGLGADTVFPPGSQRPLAGSVLERVLTGETVYHDDMRDLRYPEDAQLIELGLESEVIAPLQVGPRAVGMISVARERTGAFAPEEVELVTLLGRFVATAVQNIRAYESERATVEELRRLSSLRADFVSLVSHELRSPMAAVIGSARTLQQRWRELSPEQRESFLALIADETSRLAELVADVLDTSRIEAGTFSYVFADVDFGELVREVSASAELGQDEVRVRASVHGPLPAVRGDRERLRQVLTNLVDNAVKYSPAGEEVDVTASIFNGRLLVEVTDRGPGVPADEQQLIFEKFGRAKTGTTMPGTGLGLFIAQSIAEAHGGTLEVHSAPDLGATFALSLPAEPGGWEAR
jgi:signal transduction histidine kinase